MNIKNIRVGIQIRLALAFMLCFILLLGVFAYRQTDRIHEQIEIMYNHPLPVRVALGELKADIIEIQRDMRDIFIVNDKRNTEQNIQEIDILESHGFEQIAILERAYLGDKKDITELKENYIKWNTQREEASHSIVEGNMAEASKHIEMNGDIRIQAEKLLAVLKKINAFATQKSETLYENSYNLNNNLNVQIILIELFIILLTLAINYVLFRNVKIPVNEFIETSKKFDAGDLKARNNYSSKNEFGALSKSFNTMVDNIQLNVELNELFANVSNIMLLENEARPFFNLTLSALARNTDSQMAAVYLLNDDKKHFEHFVSFGLNEKARLLFDANSLEGEFGTVLTSKLVQHITADSDKLRFVYSSVAGEICPVEMITIPILSGIDVIGIISLASIKPYSKRSVQLIEKLLVTLSTRVVGILAFNKIKTFSTQLENQNFELQTQKSELSSQSTELSQQNAELEMQKAQLTEASMLKTNFLSNMSHELRTPLNSVIALSGVLNRKLTNQIPAEEYNYLKVIERNGKHLLELINDILDISRIEAGKEEIEVTKFNTSEMVNDVVMMIHPQAHQKQIDLLFTTDKADVYMIGDSAKCRHILQNLIGNAVKFTEKGKVEVTVEHKNKQCIVKVIDTGIGINENNLSHIFDEFRQADGSTSRRYGGSGLGLAIARKYANLLGGTIDVKSTIGVGSEFTVTLPLLYSAENRVIEEAQHIQIKHPILKIENQAVSNIAEKKNILLVEDSEPAVIQMKDFLEESGYNIIVANNGAEALQIIDKVIPDAMILDLMMPEVDGFEVLRQLRNAEPTAHIPVLILTAKHITKDDLKTLKRNNVHQLIQKGDVNREELLAAVESMVTKHDSKQQPEADIHKVTIPQFDGKPKVLVVEDNADNMITVKALLGDDFEIYEAYNGLEGVAKAIELKPHFILMDIALPEIDGIEAFKRIRKHGDLERIPIIALTASAMNADRETILSHGFDGYIAKPIEAILFYRIINQVLYGK